MSSTPPPSDVPVLDPADSDDEVDQLISDSESPETEPDHAAGAYRVPGHTLLPAVRLGNIMSADGTCCVLAGVNGLAIAGVTGNL
ncbi:hypothetical protein C0993_004301, partial [Termitomyces sp. T159_Od127]